MARRIHFYRCPVCHSVIELVDDGGHSLTCCGHHMELLKAKTSGEGAEYHIPELRHENGLLYVTVGQKMHPQSEEHHIQFIVFVTKQTVRRSNLRSEAPASTIFTDKEHGDVYAYCNVHGLWKISF